MKLLTSLNEALGITEESSKPVKPEGTSKKSASWPNSGGTKFVQLDIDQEFRTGKYKHSKQARPGLSN